MSVGSIGSSGSVSFWQQDQDSWNQAQAQAQSSAASTSLITTMGSLMVNQAKGLASIANQEAIDRTNAQLQAALQSAVQASTGSSSPGSTGSNSSSTGVAATGIGTVPLSATTSLLTVGIPPNGTITVSDGTNTTTYASNGTDTVRDLINAINDPIIAANAEVTASLDTSGHLVLTGNNKNVSISVGGVFASNVGFGAKNDSFQPTAPTPSTSNSTTAPSASSASSSSPGASSTSSAVSSTNSSASSITSSTPLLFNSAYALQTSGTAETLLASSGALLNTLA